jgi:uroporphyrinogen III methyltransferase/synthase
MGVGSAAGWTTALIDAGKSSETPAAIVRRCSLPDQRTLRCRLGEVPRRLVEPPAVEPPAIIVVGQAALPELARGWFENRPLFGCRILVTRPEEQSAELADELAEWGAQVLVQPAIELGPPEDWKPVDDALRRLESFDWLVFSSSNGVRYFIDHLLATGRDLRSLAKVRLAAIGPGTSAALNQYHLKADLQPDEYRAEALAEALRGNARGKRFLLLRASRGREVLAERLQAGGGQVEQVVVYASRDTTRVKPEVQRAMEDGRVDWVTVTSSAIARSLARLFGDRLNRCKIVSISPVTTATLQELGLQPAAEARKYTMQGVVRAILDRADGKGGGGT